MGFSRSVRVSSRDAHISLRANFDSQLYPDTLQFAARYTSTHYWNLIRKTAKKWNYHLYSNQGCYIWEVCGGYESTVSINWIPNLNKTPYKERYIAGSSTCSTKELSIHLTKILSAVKEGQQKYCETVYSRSDINHMWILKNSKDLLDNPKSRSFSQVSSIKTFDLSTLYTTLLHDKLKNPLKRNNS